MSFLLRRRNIFLFVFFFFVFFTLNQNITLAQMEAGGYELPSASQPQPTLEGVGNTFQESTSKLADTSMNAILGLDALGIQIASPIAAVIGFILMSLSNILLGIAAFGFNVAIDIGVVGISDIVNGTDVIKSAWEIFRNIANVGLIFAILFIAIQTILRTGGYDGKVLLGRVIVAGLMMNFSFFFAAIVVDISNEMSLTIYDEIEKEVEGGSAGGGDGLNLGGFFFEKTGPALFMAAVQAPVDKNTESYLNKTVEVLNPVYGAFSNTIQFLENSSQKALVMAIGFMLGALTSLILACVLFIGMTMIIGRVIAILILLVVAPIAFASMVLPNTQKISKEWWGSLVGHSFFLPAFMLFMLVGVKITKLIPDVVKKAADTSQNSVGIGDFVGMIKMMAPLAFTFAMIIGIFIMALVMAKKISSGGNAAVGKISASVSSATGGVLAGSAAFFGRNTIGAGANALSKNERVQEFLRNRMPIIGGTLGKQLEGIAKNSFDARSSRAFKGVASATGVGGDFAKTFKPAKDGFKGQSDRLSKTIVETYNAIPDREDTNAIVAPKKADLDKANIDSLSQKEKIKRMEELSKKLGVDPKTRIGYDAAVQNLKTIETRQKTAQVEYEKAKNPAKASLVQAPDSNVSIKNVWIAGPTNAARKIVKEKFRDKKEDNKEHKELLAAIKEMNKPTS